MARPRRQSALSSTRTGVHVPEPLTSRLHPMWRDPAAIGHFCAAHGLTPGLHHGPLSAFRRVADAYAIGQGWVRYYGANPHPFPLEAEQRRHGIPMFGCALESREHRGMLDRALSDDEWGFIANAERRHLADAG